MYGFYQLFRLLIQKYGETDTALVFFYSVSKYFYHLAFTEVDNQTDMFSKNILLGLIYQWNSF